MVSRNRKKAAMGVWNKEGKKSKQICVIWYGHKLNPTKTSQMLQYCPQRSTSLLSESSWPPPHFQVVRVWVLSCFLQESKSPEKTQWGKLEISGTIKIRNFLVAPVPEGCHHDDWSQTWAKGYERSQEVFSYRCGILKIKLTNRKL